jgi:hypothetical protein
MATRDLMLGLSRLPSISVAVSPMPIPGPNLAGPNGNSADEALAPPHGSSLEK